MIFTLAIFGSFTGETGKAVEVYAPQDTNFLLQLIDQEAKGFFLATSVTAKLRSLRTARANKNSFQSVCN